MSKSNNKNNIDEQNEDQPVESGSTASASALKPTESGSPDFITDLLKNGTVILEAPTREALAELVNNIPTDCKYCAGAVGRKQDGSAYIIRIDTI